MKEKQEAPVINIGANYDTVKETRLAINDILKAQHVDNETKMVALKTLRRVCSVENATISNCSIVKSYDPKKFAIDDK